eukprot:Phypoly_transcript_12175.p1 GENE.Phypoly_transcript_12175~~Phypoly_transcript_12175.p1  ORF type:complete len:184 (+),score=7.04 Phypoly_transcript_12175:194-745(+)
MANSRTFFDYNAIIQLDNQLYPTDSAVTLNSIKQWYSYMPELCFALTQGNEDIGICVWIPLNELGWTKMVEGTLSEDTIQLEHVFDPQHDHKLYLHLYHIEKLSPVNCSIWKESLLQTNKRINLLKLACEVYGMSAYCTTKSGIHLTTKIWGWHELGYKSNEYILQCPEKTVTKNIIKLNGRE